MVDQRENANQRMLTTSTKLAESLMGDVAEKDTADGLKARFFAYQRGVQYILDNGGDYGNVLDFVSWSDEFEAKVVEEGK